MTACSPSPLCADVLSIKLGALMLQIYRDCRDLIINKYREAPKQRLAFATAQQAAADSATRTDAQGLRRIYDFLDAWGLINYEAADGPAHGLSSLPAVVASSGKPARGRATSRCCAGTGSHTDRLLQELPHV